MRCARRNTDRNIANAEVSNSVHGGDPDARMLGCNTFEHALHFLDRKALVGFVVEPGNLFTVGVVTHDPMEDADTARARMLDGFSDFVE